MPKRASRQRGRIEERGPGVFLVRVFRGKDATGKKKYIARTIRGRKSDAKATLTEMLRGGDTRSLAAPGRRSVNDWLDEWLKDWCGETKPKRPRAITLKDYEKKLRLYVRPHIGSRQLAKLSDGDVQTMIHAIAKQGLSRRTIQFAVGLLRGALESAIRHGVLARNPADYVTIPQSDDEEEGKERETRPLTVEEARRFLDAAAGTPREVLWRVMLDSGVRPSEALALAWSDFDLDAGRMTIRRSVVKDGRRWVFAEPKTKGSRRTIALSPNTVSAVRAHRRARAEVALSLCAPEALVFGSDEGKPLDLRSTTRWYFKPILACAGLPPMRVYDLRHTMATLLLANGVPVKVVSERLGHASAKMTLDVYAHVIPGMQEDAAAKLESLLFATG